MGIWGIPIDVLILAGGLGTRLRGVWDGPKCLAPVAGRPLLDRLLRDHVLPLPGLDRVLVQLGYQGITVSEWLNRARDLAKLVEWNHDGGAVRPLGSAAAMRQAVTRSALRAPLLVLNGDTLWPPGALTSFCKWCVEENLFTLVAMLCHPFPPRARYAGAAWLGHQAGLDEIMDDTRTYDFPAHLVGAIGYYVSEFVDIGTPHGFKTAQMANLA